MTHHEENTAIGQMLEAVIEDGMEALETAITILLNEAMKVEGNRVLGAEPWRRTEHRRGCANGLGHCSYVVLDARYETVRVDGTVRLLRGVDRCRCARRRKTQPAGRELLVERSRGSLEGLSHRPQATRAPRCGDDYQRRPRRAESSAESHVPRSSVEPLPLPSPAQRLDLRAQSAYASAGRRGYPQHSERSFPRRGGAVAGAHGGKVRQIRLAAFFVDADGVAGRIYGVHAPAARAQEVADNQHAGESQQESQTPDASGNTVAQRVFAPEIGQRDPHGDQRRLGNGQSLLETDGG